MRLADRFLAWRDRTIAKQSFQRWAASFPLTRRIARRRANALFDMVAGFVYTQILTACVRLDLFEILAQGPQTLEALAPRLGLDLAATQRLIDGAIALGLVERRSRNRVGLGPHGAALVGNEGVIAMICHHAMLYEDLADPIALLKDETRPTRLQSFWAYARNPASANAESEGVAEYSKLMAASQEFIAEDVLASYDVAKHQTLLDIGGGEGVFAAAACRRASQLDAIVFDLPAVVQRARERFSDLPRLTFRGGDFFKDLPEHAADLVSLIRIIHDHDDEAAVRILGGAYRALRAGGTLLLAEPMAATRGAERIGDAYFGFYLLAMGSGRPRRAETLMAMLESAGFADISLRSTARPMLVRTLTARKPESDTNV